MSLIPIKIRAATINDSETIAELISVLAHKYIVNEFSDSGKAQFLKSNNTASIKSFINSGFKYFIAEEQENRNIIGLISIRENNHLYHLFVAEQYQRKGIAQKLWEKAKNDCLKSGNPGTFTVNSSNNAIAVYESFGFQQSEPTQELNGVLFNPMILKLN